MSGESVELNNDNEILSIKSPQSSIEGPYTVIYKDIKERWVIVAMKWNKLPRLGIRWFWGNVGNPFSSAHPTWFVIPSQISNSILNGLTIDHSFKIKIEKFLTGEIEGSDLNII